MQEVVTNLHVHTRYSDGHANHAEIAQAALKAHIDVVIVTDHNVYVNGVERYISDGNQHVLLLIGEEVHDRSRQPQKNHMLVVGANREFAQFADDPQLLADTVRKNGGLTFLAHIVETAAPAVNEPDISWVDWQVKGFTGIELWNGMSEFKTRIRSKLHAMFYAIIPETIACGPEADALQRWDMLLAQGGHVVAVGGSDAHALNGRMGPFHKTLFPYEFHFRGINNHLLILDELKGELNSDRKQVLDALARGRSFIGYDLPASTRGFRFSAHGRDNIAWMGESIFLADGVTLKVHVPQLAECSLVKDGKVIKRWSKRQSYALNIIEPGVYRVEAYINYLGRRRGWIFSNPIYVK